MNTQHRGVFGVALTMPTPETHDGSRATAMSGQTFNGRKNAVRRREPGTVRPRGSAHRLSTSAHRQRSHPAPRSPGVRYRLSPFWARCSRPGSRRSRCRCRRSLTGRRHGHCRSGSAEPRKRAPTPRPAPRRRGWPGPASSRRPGSAPHPVQSASVVEGRASGATWRSRADPNRWSRRAGGTSHRVGRRWSRSGRWSRMHRGQGNRWPCSTRKPMNSALGCLARCTCRPRTVARLRHPSWPH